jgi:type 1 glutamine amidotransferase
MRGVFSFHPGSITRESREDDRMKTLLRSALAALALLIAGSPAPAIADDAKIVVIAGKQSHGPGDHEFNAGCKLLVECLKKIPGVNPVFVAGGWPKDESVFEGAKSVVFFMDGGGGHPIIQGDHLSTIKRLMDQGVGLVCLHYAVEIPKERGGKEFLDWMGGYYESGFSTNPHWVAEIKSLPEHPITRGVKPFAVRDEWYYNMRFRPEMKGVTSILVAKPSDETRKGASASPRGPYPHIVADSGRDEVLAWSVERQDGGRGFGFTGAHAHKNWGNDDFRKLVLNAILWTAKLDIPPDGTPSSVSEEDLTKNLDPKGKR